MTKERRIGGGVMSSRTLSPDYNETYRSFQNNLCTTHTELPAPVEYKEDKEGESHQR